MLKIFCSFLGEVLSVPSFRAGQGCDSTNALRNAEFFGHNKVFDVTGALDVPKQEDIRLVKYVVDC